MAGKEPPRMMTEAEVAAYLRTTPEDVWALVEARQIAVHVLSRRVARFSESAVEEFTAQRP